MDILLVIAHPAHVHFFRNFIREMEERGHELHVMLKERENTKILMDQFGLDHQEFGKTYPDRFSKGYGVFYNDISLLRKIGRNTIDVTASIGGLYSVHAGKMLDAVAIDFMDTEGARFTNMLTFPFADMIATPDCYSSPVPEDKHIPYPGYHELAYLHPNRYEPDGSILDHIDVGQGEYIVVRFSSLDASHQRGERALNIKEKLQLIRYLEGYGRVYVNSESRLPSSLKKHRIPVPDDKFLDLLAFSKLYVGEGATAASEAGVLGVPWIYISKKGRCYLDDQQKRYSLGKHCKDLKETKEAVIELLQGDQDFKRAQKRLLRDKIDVTGWMIELFEDLDI